MTNLGIINQFFNERIRLVDGQTKTLLQKLKFICEARASGRMSEQKALIEIEKVSGVKSNTKPLASNFDLSYSPRTNLFAGVRTNHKKEKAVLNGLFDFNNVPKRDQFPVLGLKPLDSKSKKKKFIVSPMSRSWFDSKDFKQPKGVAGGLASQLVANRFNESNKAMKNMFSTAKQNMNFQPVLKGMTSHMNPRRGKRKFSNKKQGVAEMMGVKL